MNEIQEEPTVSDRIAAALAEVNPTPEQIATQREQGWPDFHPEDFCHRCGERNMLWFAGRDDWLTATASWAAETGREGICCPRCFVEMHEVATGERRAWRLTPDDADLRSRVRELADEWYRDSLHMPYDSREAHENDLLAGTVVPALRALLDEQTGATS